MHNKIKILRVNMLEVKLTVYAEFPPCLTVIYLQKIQDFGGYLVKVYPIEETHTISSSDS